MSVDVMVGCYDSGGVFHCSECLHPGDAFRLAYVSDVFGRLAVCPVCGRLFPIDAVTSSGLCEMCECSAS